MNFVKFQRAPPVAASVCLWLVFFNLFGEMHCRLGAPNFRRLDKISELLVSLVMKNKN